MHRNPLLAVALLLQAGSLLAAPCAPGSLQTYIALGAGGCSIGSTVFTNFNTVPGQALATQLDPGTVLINPGAGPDFLFTLNADAGPGQLFESIFRFNAAGTFGPLGFALGSASATGDGLALGVLDVCAGGAFTGNAPSGCTGTPVSAIAFVAANAAEPSTSVNVSASLLDIFVDLTADGGATGSASLGSASLTFSEVPEPETLGLAGLALVALGLFHRKTANR